MSDSSVDPGEFQKLIGNIMKQKYEHEQRVADNDLSRHRQRTERSRSASRTPDKRRSISNASRGSRFAEQRSSSVQPGGRPPFIPSRGRTPTQVMESSQPAMQEPNSTSSDTKTEDIKDTKSNDNNNNDVQPINFQLDFTNFTTTLNILQKKDNDEDDNVQKKVNVVPMESETLPEDSSFTPTARQHKFIQSPKLDTGTVSVSSQGDAKEDQLKLQIPLVECSRCVALETKVHEMQDALNKLSTEVTILAAKQGSSDNKPMADGTISELPENLDELGKTMEERFLTVVTALAKRVRQLEVDLEASLQQVRIMEAAAIERDVKLNQTKVGHDQIAESVAEVLQQVPIEYERDIINLYKIFGLNTNSVRKVLNSSNPSESVDMLLSTPVFSRILRLVMDNNNDIFNTLHGQGFRSEEEDFSYYDQAPLSSRLSNSLTPRQKIPVPLHEQLLGIVLQDEKDLLGVRVISVPPRSSAARAVRPGDVIVQVNRVTVRSIADVSYVLSRVQPNALITLGMQAPDEPYVEVVRVMPLEVF